LLEVFNFICRRIMWTLWSTIRFLPSVPLQEFLLYARQEQVVEQNRRRRSNGFFGHPWPEQFLIIGDFANGDVIFLDTTRARTSVLVASHELTSAAELAVEDTGFELIEWANAVLEAWRQQE